MDLGGRRSPFIASVLPSLVPDTAYQRLKRYAPHAEFHSAAGRARPLSSSTATAAAAAAAGAGVEKGEAWDTVALRGMEFFAHHGVLPEVRALPPPPATPTHPLPARRSRLRTG